MYYPQGQMEARTVGRWLPQQARRLHLRNDPYIHFLSHFSSFPSSSRYDHPIRFLPRQRHWAPDISH